MRVFSLFVLIFVVGSCSHTTFSQCCCSGAEVTITDGAGDPMSKGEIKVTELSRENGGRIQFFEKEPKVATFQFHVGCGNGKETLIVESGSSLMRIRFKLYGEFGHPKTEIVFSHGDYVAEFVKERDDEIARTVTIRAAAAEEMKEVEPPDTDGTSDETANAFRLVLETGRFSPLSFYPARIRARPTDIFPSDRNS